MSYIHQEQEGTYCTNRKGYLLLWETGILIFFISLLNPTFILSGKRGRCPSARFARLLQKQVLFYQHKYLRQCLYNLRLFFSASYSFSITLQILSAQLEFYVRNLFEADLWFHRFFLLSSSQYLIFIQR